MSSSRYPTTELELELNDALRDTLDQIDTLKAENARLQTKLDGLMEGFEKGGSLGILQAIGSDKTLPIDVRVRALTAAVPFERPKLSMTATTNTHKLYDILEAAKLKQKVIEQASAQDEPPPAA
jgi:hypothetical protein